MVLCKKVNNCNFKLHQKVLLKYSLHWKLWGNLLIVLSLRTYDISISNSEVHILKNFSERGIYAFFRTIAALLFFGLFLLFLKINTKLT